MPSPSQYIFGLQAAPLLASSVYILLWPAAAASMPDSDLASLSNGTIQAIRYGYFEGSIVKYGRVHNLPV